MERSNLNTLSCVIPRPEIVSKYFEKANVIDVNNQVRQLDLRLERLWVTRSGWFRIVTTNFQILL